MAPDPVPKKQEEQPENLNQNRGKSLDDLKTNIEGPLAIATETRLNSYKEQKEALQATLKTSDLKDIRLNRYLLEEKKLGGKKLEKEKLDTPTKIKYSKTETAQRLAAYTEKSSDGWYTLDYNSVGGYEHEMGVGLGDILIDEDIELIEIQQDGRTFKAKRGFNSQGRPCFQEIDEQGNPINEYTATQTGDKFRIINDKENIETNPNDQEQLKKYSEKIQKTELNLLKHDIQIQQNGGRLEHEVSDSQASLTPGEIRNARKIDEKQIEKRHGKDLIDYGKKIAKEFNIEWELIVAIVQYESGWDPTRPYRGKKNSSASGFGQFLNSTWNEFIASPEAKKQQTEFPNQWPSNWNQELGKNDDPRNPTDRFNGKHDPYQGLFATIWYTHRNLNNLGALNKPMEEKAIIAYLAHNQGETGARHYLKFMEKMRADGFSSRNEIAAAYNANPGKYNAILYPTQRTRIVAYGIEDFLSVYFKFAKGIAANASASALSKNPEQIKALGKTVYSIRPHQSAWILGSSIANGFNNIVDSKSVGIFGIEGINSNSFRPHLAEYINAMKEIDPKPKRIILMGFAVNGLNLDKDPSNLPKQIASHRQLIDYLHQELGQNIEIKVARTHPYGPKAQAIANFNDAMKDLGLLAETGDETSAELHPYGAYKNWATTLNLNNIPPLQPKTTLEIPQEETKTAFERAKESNLFSGEIKEFDSQGNGNRKVILLKPQGFDPKKPTKLLVHFHGMHSEYLTKPPSEITTPEQKDFAKTAKNRFSQMLTQAEENAKEYNIIIAYPISGGPDGNPNSDSKWMAEGDNFDNLVQEIQKQNNDIKFDQIYTSGHSAGGQALRNIAMGTHTTQIAKMIWLDSSYGEGKANWLLNAQQANPNLKHEVFLQTNKLETSADTHTKTIREELGKNKNIKFYDTKTKHANMIAEHLFETIE